MKCTLLMISLFISESGAEYMEKPLIALRVTDLVTDGYERTFADTVSDLLKNADRLGAIILMDEADVILEARSFEDVKRNGIVSGESNSPCGSEILLTSPAFLRTLEYFNGIIFMTTNRMKTMDAAFESRIQVAIEYKTLSVVTRRKIWTMFIHRLEDADSREELLEELDYLKRQELNGRQIRNVMKVAESLALARALDASERSGEVKPTRVDITHVRRALDETLGFQHYFEGRKDMSRGLLKVSLQGSGRNVHESEDDGE
jgi:SpoVK/Ycf46/Vps4 family AAA+-type ATPase